MSKVQLTKRGRAVVSALTVFAMLGTLLLAMGVVGWIETGGN